MLVILLMLALLAIALVEAAPSVAVQVRRDQEEELIRRGNQYVRAIRLFYRKFGRYPTSLDELKDTNHLRFLRREYKDPVTGKDFVLLHPADVKYQPTGFFGKSLLPPGANSNGNPFGTPVVSPMTTPGGSGAANDINNPQTSGNNAPPPGGQVPQPQQQPAGQVDSNGLRPGQIFGGGPIVGVSSSSPKASIKVWREKDHYNDWQFFWVPAMDQAVPGGQMFNPNSLVPGGNPPPGGPSGPPTNQDVNPR